MDRRFKEKVVYPILKVKLFSVLFFLKLKPLSSKHILVVELFCIYYMTFSLFFSRDISRGTSFWVESQNLFTSYPSPISNYHNLCLENFKSGPKGYVMNDFTLIIRILILRNISLNFQTADSMESNIDGFNRYNGLLVRLTSS